MASKTVETTFRFLNDRTATEYVLRDFDRIDDALDQQAHAVQQVERAYDQMEQTARRVASAERDAAETRIRAAKQTADIYGDVASRTTNIAGLASNLSPALGGRLMIAADILDATEGAKLLTAELPKMTAQLAAAAGGVTNLALAGGVAGAALIGLYAAIQILGDRAEDSRKKVQAEIDMEQRFATLKPEQMTSTELDAAIRQLFADINDKAIQHARASGKGLEQWEGMGLFERVGELSGIADQGLEDRMAQIDKLEAGIESDQLLLAELMALVGSELIKQNDIAAQGAEERTAREQDALQLIQDMGEQELEVRRKVATYTVQQAQDEAAELERQRAVREQQLGALQAAFDAGAISEDALATESARLDGEITGLTADIDALTGVILESAQARAEEAAQLEKTRAALQGFFKGLVEGGQTAADSVISMSQRLQQGATLIAKHESEREAILADTAARLADAETKHAAERLQAVTEFEAARTEREQAHADRLAELQATHEAVETKLREEFERGEADRIERYYADRARKERAHRETLLDAASRLDATAVWEEQRRFTREQEDDETSFKAETKQREEQFRDRLKQEDQAYEDRRRQAEQAFRKDEIAQRAHFDRAQRQRDSDYQNQLAALRKDGQDKLTALNTNFTNELKALMGYQTDEYGVRQDHYDALLAQLNQWKKDGDAILASGGTGGTSGASGSSTPVTVRRPGGGAVITPFDSGGYGVPGLAHVRPDEWVASPATTRLLEGGIGGPLTQANVQRLVQHNVQSRSVGRLTVNIYESTNPARTRQMVHDELNAIVNG